MVTPFLSFSRLTGSLFVGKYSPLVERYYHIISARLLYRLHLNVSHFIFPHSALVASYDYTGHVSGKAAPETWPRRWHAYCIILTRIRGWIQRLSSMTEILIMFSSATQKTFYGHVRLWSPRMMHFCFCSYCIDESAERQRWNDPTLCKEHHSSPSSALRILRRSSQGNTLNNFRVFFYRNPRAIPEPNHDKNFFLKITKYTLNTAD
jgi:hypothetical protein